MSFTGDVKGLAKFKDTFNITNILGFQFSSA